MASCPPCWCQLAAKGDLEDSNKYVQVILDTLVKDDSDPAMEVKARTIALLSACHALAAVTC
jgi:hypothetical protein